jgi:ABC-2 type transport system ATP-binding protein
LIKEENKLTVDVTSPEEENPDIVSTIVSAGGRIETVSVVGSTLEDAYLKLVRELQ